MQDYRIYLVPKRAGIATPSIILRLKTDAEAVAHAAQMTTATHAAEIWRQDKLICRIPAQGGGKTKAARLAAVPIAALPVDQAWETPCVANSAAS